VIRTEDLEELFAQLRAHWMALTYADKVKGYCFQWALGIELLVPNSKLLKFILGEIDREAVPSIPYQSLGLFQTDEEATAILDKNQIGISIDPKAKDQKTGDIAFMVIT
jgi:hypothetical protein